jgi:uncharacterized protein YbbC (DUF1343 family)
MRSSFAVGVDRVKAEPSLIQGLGRIGIVTHQACMSTDGVPTCDVVSEQNKTKRCLSVLHPPLCLFFKIYGATKAVDGSKVVAVFGPQHGFGQTEQDNMKVRFT